MKKISLLCFLIGAVFSSASCAQDPAPLAQPSPPTEFSEPVKVELQGYEGDVMEPFLSRDDTLLFFNNKNEPAEETDLFYARKINDTTFAFAGPVQNANTDDVLDGVASMDRNNLFYFVSTRDYGDSLKTLFNGTFHNGALDTLSHVEGISRNTLGWLTMDAEISPDGNSLYFADTRFSGGAVPDSSEIKIALKNNDGFLLQNNSEDLLKNVNVDGLNYAPAISDDGLTLYFTRLNTAQKPPSPQIYVASRASIAEPFHSIRLISEAEGFVEAPTLSNDGKRLYYHAMKDHHYALYMLRKP